MKRECKWCGDAFEPRTHQQVFCKAACRFKHKSIFANVSVATDDFWSVTTPYGSHGFDGLVANWLRSAPILGSTLIGA